jgi:hypothetical protein
VIEPCGFRHGVVIKEGNDVAASLADTGIPSCRNPGAVVPEDTHVGADNVMRDGRASLLARDDDDLVGPV